MYKVECDKMLTQIFVKSGSDTSPRQDARSPCQRPRPLSPARTWRPRTSHGGAWPQPARTPRAVVRKEAHALDPPVG